MDSAHYTAALDKLRPRWPEFSERLDLCRPNLLRPAPPTGTTAWPVPCAQAGTWAGFGSTAPRYWRAWPATAAAQDCCTGEGLRGPAGGYRRSTRGAR